MPAYRDSITPMDFEYDNNTGPIDPQSPFAQLQAKKRTHSVFDSPSKSSFATPNHPKLNEPNNQRFLFSREPVPYTPQRPQAQNNKVWELRTPQSVVDSSGGETPNSPGQDSDAPTPDTQLALTMGELSHGERRSPRKRESFIKRILSPSKEKEKNVKEKPYSKKAENRVLKRRAKSRRGGDYDSDEKTPDIPQPIPPIGFAAKIPGVLAWIEAHPNLPNVLSYYMQFMINAAIGLFLLWIAYGAYAAIRADIDIEASKIAQEVMHDIATCAQHYRSNGCEPNPVPALTKQCHEWKMCKEKDPYQVAHARVGARTFAMIFNSFVEEFSCKSMLFTAIILFGSFNLSNWAFGFWREKGHHPSQSQQHHDYNSIPQTPHHYQNGGYMIENGWQTPYGATPYGSVQQRPMLQHASQSMPAALPMASGGEDASPSKKAVYRR